MTAAATAATTGRSLPTTTRLEQLILAAITDAIGPSGAATGGLTYWSQVRRRVPGNFDEKQAALMGLVYDGRVYLMQVGGRPLVGLGDEHDVAMAGSASPKGSTWLRAL